MKRHNYMAPLIKVLKPDPELMNGIYEKTQLYGSFN